MYPGEKIREFRKGKRLTLKQFGETLGYSYVHVSNIERGALQPSRDFLKKLNEVFGISSDYILYNDPQGQIGIELAVHPEKYTEGDKRRGMVREIESKYQILPPTTKKLIDNLVEILESKNEVMIDALKGNIKAFLEAIRSSQKNDENKGGD